MDDFFDKFLDTARGVFKDITQFDLTKLQLQLAGQANAAQAATTAAAGAPEAKKDLTVPLIIGGVALVAIGIVAFRS